MRKTPRTTLPKSGKLIKAYERGDTFRKYCLTYGTIKSVTDYEDAQQKPCRHYEVEVDGIAAHIEMNTGEVVGYGYKLIGG